MSEPKWVPRYTDPPEPGIIRTRSIVSHRTGRGIVVIEWNEEKGQFDPEDARVFAHTLLREADNAETDAFVYQFLKDKLQAEPHIIAGFITDFRTERARREQLAGLRSKKAGDDIPEDDIR